MIQNMLDWLVNFNEYYADAIQALTPIIVAFASIIYYKIYKESRLAEGDAVTIVSPKFCNYWRKFKILAVHKYEKSDESISGYKHLSQNSRPDQWKKLIEIKTSLSGLRKEIIPKDPDDILLVVISRNGTEKWKTIKINQ